MKPSPPAPAWKKTALILSALLLSAAVFSLLFLIRMQKSTAGLQACIYQNGQLLRSISLDAVTNPELITITGENGASNTIEVRPGSIGILSASCPDKVCVHQGFISTTLLPITCLPNRLVIQLEERDEGMPDAVAH